MDDSPALASQRLLDSLPDGCELETSVELTPAGWRATACILNPHDSTKPLYLGRGQSEEEALLRAIAHCADYWARRNRPGAGVISGWRETEKLADSGGKG